MILTQKYHSVSEIDEEFIPGLEKLLSEYYPSFEWIKKRENLEPESIHYTYYLFFGSKHNEPVGFAGLSIQKLNKAESWYQKLFTKKEIHKKFICWKAPGPLEEGMVFEPMYIKPGIKKTKEIIQSYLSRSDVSWQSLTFSKAYTDLKEGLNVKSDFSEKSLVTTLVKSKNSYANYLDALPFNLQKEITEQWKKLSIKLSMDIGDFDNFKSLFEYREGGQHLYKDLKKDPLVQLNINEQTSYITFEQHGQIQAILFLIKGKKQHLFFDWKIFNSEITNQMMVQLAIMKFYEMQSSTHLHYLGTHEIQSYLKKVEFSSKELLQVNLRKVS